MRRHILFMAESVLLLLDLFQSPLIIFFYSDWLLLVSAKVSDVCVNFESIVDCSSQRCQLLHNSATSWFYVYDETFLCV